MDLLSHGITRYYEQVKLINLIMAKPTKHAAAMCTVLSIIALIGIILGFVTGNVLFPLFLLLPTIIYEIYRTEGASTKLSSWGLLGVFIAEIVLILFDVSFNIAEWLGMENAEIAGYNVPLGDIRMIGPVIMAVLSIVLIVRTRGIYTKWLAVIVIIVSFVSLYLLDPDIFQQFLKVAVEEGIDSV